MTFGVALASSAVKWKARPRAFGASVFPWRPSVMRKVTRARVYNDLEEGNGKSTFTWPIWLQLKQTGKPFWKSFSRCPTFLHM